MSGSSQVYRSSTTAPVNIAVIKYWGKRDTALNLPTNSSLSVTLSQKSLRAHTTASCSESFSGPDSLILNGEKEEIQSSKRTQACLKNLRSLREQLEAKDGSLPKLSKLTLRLVSANNFPTAAGLASSAAGFAALVRAIADLYELPQSPEELSIIARQGSGSACRSLMGGFVAWRAGTKEDGSDSLAEEVAPVSHWPDMRALVLVVSAEKKGVSSTAGMQTTVETSTLAPARFKEIVPRRMKEIEKAIHEKDFETFARITMQDSNSFHAICLDSWPPIHYMNDVSRAAMNAVETANRKAGKLICAYTFDAGPNAVIYYLEEHTHQIAGVFRSILPRIPGWEGEFGEAVRPNEFGSLEQKSLMTLKAGVSRVICTGVGGGPEKIEEHLVDEKGNAVPHE
ncbi:diphosphomevalonate decarboxylase [Elasticomyces elasticus]|uniref:Diphosphomevalonate decarboxylase n=1 Tax=Exophiala sideris TaxID=1016849 RepID=A0ABR0IWC2_9EURO|nr:diphosphomevalonate decarboxylase [Elasticomyces elasticus]KAK5021600.1 diphosphomevalonate decarboxylase [Exophiala sideris]KAK5024767.1 diphosphomevalonate decarboxylase [Exophiala sideris]KAK5049737.1 diphosphomevalonate decarboxylase [Exophiala sideris]KAK5176718.1 diphosphomevalonate decarboxylase [Eurotiomycetes sp. CCFEE 6388]